MNGTARESINLLVTLSLSILLVESAIMFILPYVGIGHSVGENLLDAAALTVMLFPVLYFLVVRRLTRKNSELENHKSKLQLIQAELEQRVAARTGELNQSLEQLQVHQREITILGEMTRLLQAAKTLDEANSIARLELVRLLPGLAGTLYLLNASRNLLEPQLVWGGAATAELVEPGNCWALRRGKPHQVSSGSGIVCSHMRECPAAWRLCIPLMAASETMGVLCLEATSELAQGAPARSHDAPGRLDFYETVAESLSMAISNIRLCEKLQHQALRDPMTGLYNRRYMLDALERELQVAARHDQSLSVIMLDIDQFKLFNDTFGHDAGDSVIAAVGEILRKSVRQSDFVCRHGGEEFMLVLPKTSAEAAAGIAEKLRREVEDLTMHHKGQALGHITISAGFATYPDIAAGHEALIEAADQALYRSKRNGRNCVTPANALSLPSLPAPGLRVTA